MNHTIKKFYLNLIGLIVLSSCISKDTESHLFKKLDADQTGILFENRIESDDIYNIQSDIFIYNGAGVAIGDINNNGYPDIYFSGNQVTGRLYLNKGDYQFEDITESAGITTSRWVTGASMVDINNNGLLDIYLSVSGPEWTNPEDRENLLFLNNGDNTFTEAAEQFKINDSGFTTHAVFLDYNGTGYLDLFLLGNSPGEFGRGVTGLARIGTRSANPDGFDKLYRNNGDGTFTDVSEEAGILKRLGYGLGVVATDLNGNGWPDIYVSNDITPNDVLYINNGDGTFTDKAESYLRHTSFAGMGIDIADFTNNGWPDILQTDMKPRELSSRKRVSGSNTIQGLQNLRSEGYYPHYNLNTLQQNHGVTDNGDLIFSQISRIAGISDTDWSWTALFGDYNNNGWKDIVITNGYPKAVNDFDYQSEMHNARRLPNSELVKERELEILNQLHSYKVSNHLFENNGDLTFTDRTVDWGFNDPGFAYGAAHADLNNSGRLDLVINNINSPASIFKNILPADSINGNYLQIKLEGSPSNRRGIGSKIFITAEDVRQYVYHSPYRGYMSTMDDRVHFGIGKSVLVDSLEIIWPDGAVQVLYDVQPNQILTLQHEEAKLFPLDYRNHASKTHTVFKKLNTPSLTDILHQENFYSSDFSIQPLLPYKVSKQGPVFAVADVNGNGLDDLYIGGQRNIPGKLFIQQNDGSFSEIEVPDFKSDSPYEDWGAVFFDANGNGMADLYVASGSYQSNPYSDRLQDRLYINQGNGRFTRDIDALPDINIPTSAIAVADINGDGQNDLFIGGRISPGSYPKPVRSYILKNNQGHFTDVTERISPQFFEPKGMITSAIWMDFTNNGYPDLITAGEWMEIEFYQNNGTTLKNVTSKVNLPPTRGWWFSMTMGDFNGNGLTDIAVGNLGLNHSYKTSPDSPFGIYYADLNDNRILDLILSKEIEGVDYPFHGLANLGPKIHPLFSSYTSFDSFSDRSIVNIFGQSAVNSMGHYKTDTFSSIWLENNGDGSFNLHSLPNEAQISPILAMLPIQSGNFDCSDLLIAGNIFDTEANVARADAGNGLFLTCEPGKQFKPIPVMKSGFFAPKNVRSIQIIKSAENNLFLVGNNNDKPDIFILKQ